MSQTRKWSVLAAVLVLAIFAAGWFLLVSPKRSQAADLKDQAASQAAANATLTQKLQVLKAQQQDLPQQQAKLARFKVQIPDNPALPSLIRDLSTAGRKTGVSIDALAPSEPVVAAAPGTTAATPVAPTGAQSAGAAPTLYVIPLDVKVSGNYFELEQFVNRLEGLKRSFNVSGFTLTPATASTSATATDGSTDTLSIDIQGQVFLSQAATAAAPTTPVADTATGS